MDQGNSDSNNQNTQPLASPTGSSNPPASSGSMFGNVPSDTASNFGMDTSAAPAPASNFDQAATLAQPAVTPEPTPAVATPPDLGFNAPQPTSQPVAAADWANPSAPTETNPFASSQPQTPASSLGGTMPGTNPTPELPPVPVTQNIAGSAPTPFNPFATPEAAQPMPQNGSNDSMPTDLSNLVGTPAESTSYIPQAPVSSTAVPAATEPLVVPPAGPGGEVAQATSVPGGTGGFPKILIIIGVLLLLGVAGASAYFILGIGKPVEPAPVSIPAEEQTTPIPTMEVTPTPSTSSANFSDLTGNGATASGSQTSGSGSAYDLLKKKPTATPSATR